MSILGIDLGTANSAAFFFDGEGKPKIINPSEGIASLYGKLFPSYVEFDQAGEIFCVGKAAYDHYCEGTSNTVVWGSKRLIGISFREAKKELRHIDYFIDGKKEDGTVIIPVDQKIYTPGDIAEMILDKIKKDALNTKVNNVGKISGVVVSHPAYFDSSRREATLQAVRRVFKDILPEKSIERISEPVAAALGYGLELPPEESVVCVIDLGAGTLDIVTTPLIKDEKGKLDIMPDRARGNAAFGGIDIDGLLVDWVIREYGFAEFERVREPGVIKENDRATQALCIELKILRSEVEKAKIRLSHPKINQRDVDVRYKGQTVVITFTKEKLEELMDAPLPRERVNEFFGFSLSDEEISRVQESLKEFHPGGKRELPSLLDILRLTIKDSLARGNYKISDIDHVLLVGGPMHMPCIRKVIKEVFAANEAVVQELERIEQEGFPVNPMECVARGASIYGYLDEVEKPRDILLNYHYALVTREEEGTDGKICVYYDNKSQLKLGDPVPKKSVAKRQEIRLPEIRETPITILQGKETEVPDSEIVWKKSTTYSFTPLYDSEGKANYTITLDVDKDQIVDCVVDDKVSKKKYPFAALSRQVGEVLEREKYVVGPQRDGVVTVEQLKGLFGFLDDLLLAATAWLMQRHDPRDEANRAKIKELAGLIPLHKSNLEPVIKKYEDFPDDYVVTDPTHQSFFYRAAATAQELLALIPPKVVPSAQVTAACNKAQSLLPYVDQLRDKPGGNSKLREKMLNESQELEKTLRLLPRGVDLTDPNDIANWTHLRSLTEVLKSTINALRESLGMPPVTE
jgi:molecular chaperone DnaK (HSP70)